MNKISTQSGITLIALIITIVVMLIIATTGIYASVERLKINNVKKMFTDIEMLDDRVLDYYAANEKLPLVENNEGTIVEIGDIANVEEATNLAIIDLSKLVNISLMYGRDFEKAKSNVSNNMDLYVINQNTFQIFYARGITANGITYYTKEEKSTNVNNGIIAYIDGESVPNEENSYYCKAKIKYMNVKNSNNIVNFSIWKQSKYGDFERIIEPTSKIITEISEDGIYQIRGENEEPIDSFKVAHKWRDWSTKKPVTCVVNGEVIKTCEICGKEENNTILATGNHDWGEWKITKEATCVLKGSKYRECKVCGEKDVEPIPLDPNNHKNWSKFVRTLKADKVMRQRTCNDCKHKEEVEEATIGDYVRYNAKIDKNGKSVTSDYVSPYNKNGYGEQPFKEIRDTNWQVLGVENGKIKLLSTPIGRSDNYYFALKGKIAYQYAIQEINNISSLYGKGKGAYAARSVTADDINTLTGFKPESYKGSSGNGNEHLEYGQVRQYRAQGSSTTYYIEKNGLLEPETVSGSSYVNVKNTYYTYDLPMGILSTNSRANSMIASTYKYLLADKCTDCQTYTIMYGLYAYNKSYSTVSGTKPPSISCQNILCNGSGFDMSASDYYIRPVVILNDEILLGNETGGNIENAKSIIIN